MSNKDEIIRNLESLIASLEAAAGVKPLEEKEGSEGCECNNCSHEKVLEMIDRARVKAVDNKSTGLVLSIMHEEEDRYATLNTMYGGGSQCARAVASLLADFLIKSSEEKDAESVATVFAVLQERIEKSGDEALVAMFKVLARRLGEKS